MKSRNIMIIEPNKLIRESLKSLFEMAGDKVFIAQDENEAINCVRNNEIDVILIEPILGTDFLINKEERVRNVLTGGTGVVLLNNIKKVYTRRFRIIFYTVTSYDNLFANSLSLEETSYLRKPESVELIIREAHRGEI